MFAVCTRVRVDGVGKNTQLILTVVDLVDLTTIGDIIYLKLTFP